MKHYKVGFSKLYSIKWVLHPNAAEQEKKLDLYLASLVFSEDLEKINNEYVVGGKALLTIEKHEEEERKHRSCEITKENVLANRIFGSACDSPSRYYKSTYIA